MTARRAESIPLPPRVGLLLAMLATAMAVACVHLRTIRPLDWEPAFVPGEYDTKELMRAVAPEQVRAHLERILALGNRYLGDEGFYRAEKYLRDRYRQAGLAVYDQGFHVPAPRTACREVLDADGRKLTDVQVYPFLPNGFQPVTTGREGITGKLVLLDESTVRTRCDFRGVIGLIDTSRPPSLYGLNWASYARMGVSALIVSHPQGLDKVDWTILSAPRQMVSGVPADFVRLAADAGIFRHVGQTITLRVRSEFVDVDCRTLIAAMKAPQAAQDAVVIAAPYDAMSLLADACPGVVQAHSLATQLATLDALLHYRDRLRRDVYFIDFAGQMMAAEGETRLLQAIGPRDQREQSRKRLQEQAGANDANLRNVEAALAPFDRPQFLRDPDATRDALDALDAATRQYLLGQVEYVMHCLYQQQSEKRLQARVAWRRTRDNYDAPEYKAYLAEKKRCDEVMGAAAMPLTKMLHSHATLVETLHVRQHCLERLRELRDYHLRRRRELSQDLAINAMFLSYRNVLVFYPMLAPRTAPPADPRPEELTYLTGDYSAGGWRRKMDCEVQGPAMNNMAGSIIQKHEWDANVRFTHLPQDHLLRMAPRIGGLPVGADLWNRFQYHGFAIVLTDRADAYAQATFPVDRPFMRDTQSMRYGLKVFGELMLNFALGSGNFPRHSDGDLPVEVSGDVWVSDIGQSIVSRFPLANALLCSRREPAFLENFSSRFAVPFLRADPYGHYAESYSPRVLGDPYATACDADGRVAFVNDRGKQGVPGESQGTLENKGARMVFNIATFRASGVTLCDMTNPQTLRSWRAADFLVREGLTVPTRILSVRGNDCMTTFVEPDLRFYVQLRDGSAENEKLIVTRAFMLGITPGERTESAQEIDGWGYLAVDSRIMRETSFDIAHSMLDLNGKRLAQQVRLGIADPQGPEIMEKSRLLLARAETPNVAHEDAVTFARDAAAYQMAVYPILRSTVSGAVESILWFLAMLVPFTFFFEKLLFGFTDVRKQLLAQLVIFVAVFILLKTLHPAFALLRSSLMILLGFLIVLISVGVTVLYSGKFRENLEELRSRRGKVAAAEVNTLGVVATAFALGLNNLHRRRVRTTLTCATLVVLTFAMICFTSVTTSVVDESTSIGRASYEGLLVKPERFAPVTASEVQGMQVRYGKRFVVAPRIAWIGDREKNLRIMFPPELEAELVVGEGEPRQCRFETILQLSDREPLREKVHLLTRPRWFQPNPSGPIGVFISDQMASVLGILPSQVDADAVNIQINGRSFHVLGIFDSTELDRLVDIDGRGLLPFDMPRLDPMAVSSVLSADNPGQYDILANNDSPRVLAKNAILAPLGDLRIAIPHGTARTLSVAVDMHHLPYRQAREQIDRYLEQSGQTAYYGLDDVGYVGRRTRQSGFAGLLDLVLPLVLACVTVLNTMRGSIYERRDELYVYNAVGIAPRYIAFIFLAEGSVYAVVGSVLGFLLSQGVGKMLISLGWTGGMDMNYVSRVPIYTSLAIMGSVLLSTYFPARSAARIAAPAEDSGWRLGEPDGDLLAFALPFTFDPDDRIAVLAFFHRYLLDHGEGSSGQFLCDPPHLGVQIDPQKALVPLLKTTVWLRPFDLSVSQQLTIHMPLDAETGDYIAHATLERISGTRDAWLRLNHAFVALVRGHFLHWRAVDKTSRVEMFDEARQLLLEHTATANTPDMERTGKGT